MESDDSSSRGGGGADGDLLERARRLCLAAQLISGSLPKFSIGGAVRGGNQDEETTATTASGSKEPRGNAAKSKISASGVPQAKGKGKTKSDTNSSNQRSLPPAVLSATPPPPQVPPRQRSLKKQKSGLTSANQDSLPEIAISDEQRKAREAEKVRQAQERARARVARTNQSDQLEAEREIEMRKQQLQHLEELSAEKEQLAEQNRLRAEERVRMKRQLCTQLNPIERQQSPVCHPEKPPTDPAKIERFRRETLARLHALPRNTTPKTVEPHQPDLGEPVAEADSSPERDEGAEAKVRKQKEKKLRQETAERIRRQQAIEEEQRRKEQELIQQGLLQYKNRQKELDRVAKGLGPPRKVNSVTKQSIEVRPNSGASCDETVAAVQGQILSDAADEAHSGDTQAMLGGGHFVRHGSGSFEPNEVFGQPASPEYDENEPHDHWATTAEPEEDQPPRLVISLDQQNDNPAAPTVSSATSGGKRKLPPWRRAPVPVLPAEFYSSKAVIPASPSATPSVLATASNSYTEKFKSRTPSTTSSSTSSAPSKLRATKPSSREATSSSFSSSSSSAAAATSRPGTATRDRI